MKKEFIRPSVSPWGAQFLFVNKMGGSSRLCLGNRQKNNATMKSIYTLPMIDDLMD